MDLTIIFIIILYAYNIETLYFKCKNNYKLSHMLSLINKVNNKPQYLEVTGSEKSLIRHKLVSAWVAPNMQFTKSLTPFYKVNATGNDRYVVDSSLVTKYKKQRAVKLKEYSPFLPSSSTSTSSSSSNTQGGSGSGTSSGSSSGSGSGSSDSNNANSGNSGSGSGGSMFVDGSGAAALVL